MATVTFVHFGAGETEMGIQFTTDDGAGGTVIGRTFQAVDPELKKTVLAAAQKALDAQTEELPKDLPPGAVTSALMQKRNAIAEMNLAAQAKEQAERETNLASKAKAQLEAEAAALKVAAAELQEASASLDAANAAKREELAAAAEAAAQLDIAIAAKRTELEAVAKATVEAVSEVATEAEAAPIEASRP